MPQDKAAAEEPGKPGPDEIRRYYELMQSQDLEELEVRDKDFYVKLSRRQAAPVGAWVPAAPPPKAAPAVSAPAAPPAGQPAPDNLHVIASPLAGTFYRAPSPQSPAFVKDGDKVGLGDVVCIVEAMKMMKEIQSDKACVIRKILVENGRPVSKGQDLFLVDPL